MTTLPPENRSQAVALYQQGDSIRAVAAHFGVSYGQIRNLLGDANVPLRPRGRPRKDGQAVAGRADASTEVTFAGKRRRRFDLDKAAAMYRAGLTLTQIAGKTGMSRSRVHVLLVEGGVEMRTTRHPRASRITPAKRRAILRAWKAGRSYPQIIAEVRTSTATITKVVSEAGLPLRRPRRRYDHDRMKELRALGWTLAEVAADQPPASPQYVWNVVNGTHLKSYVKRGRRQAAMG